MLLLKSILQKNIWQTFEKKLEVLSQIFNIFNCIFYALIFFFFFQAVSNMPKNFQNHVTS